MKTEYIVCDENGFRSLTGQDADDNESFSTFRAAEKRAKELAALAPGQKIGIYELVGEVEAPVAKTESFRKYPIEHYR